MLDVDKSQSRRAAQRSDDRKGQAVQAGRARRKCLIDEVSCRKIIGVIHPAIPFDTGGLCGLAVCRAHPAALPAPELLGGQAGNILIRETELVHFAHHFQMLPLVGKALSLPFQQAGVLTQGTAMGVEPHAMLPTQTAATPVSPSAPWHGGSHGCRAPAAGQRCPLPEPERFPFHPLR